MNKQAIKKTEKQAARPTQQRRLRLGSVIRQNLYEFVIQEGMKALDTLLEQEMERLCGPKHQRRGEQEAQRWGSPEGRLVMGGRRVVKGRPRARKDGCEVVLPTWAQVADEDRWSTAQCSKW